MKRANRSLKASVAKSCSVWDCGSALVIKELSGAVPVIAMERRVAHLLAFKDSALSAADSTELHDKDTPNIAQSNRRHPILFVKFSIMRLSVPIKPPSDKGIGAGGHKLKSPI